MKKFESLEGLSCRIRPICVDDAAFVVELRTGELSRSKYINPISDSIEDQVAWIEEYFTRKDDYYFVVENCFTGAPEGLIGIYNIDKKSGEWGRWIIKPGSLMAAESVELIFRFAFEELEFEKLFCRTIAENQQVVSFHDSIGQARNATLSDYILLRGTQYDAIEHILTKDAYIESVRPLLEERSQMLFMRSLREKLGSINFHHLGVATKDIESELLIFRMLGYKREGDLFFDQEQGVKGQFIAKEGAPRLELLENLPGSGTLSRWLENGVKIYHLGFIVSNLDQAIKTLLDRRFKLISPPKFSVYFKSRICFLVMPNRYVIELIEEA
ncbi:GNAT family N-acetyltransferase [Alphaproteobacteria bacterium]|nr:GNAT family N-acetyltransferase [Alphaproteobacteria bacterium]